MPLTPEDIRDKRFRSARFRRGYNQEDVDTLLDRVYGTLLSMETGGSKGRRATTADQVARSSFRSTMLSTGYDEAEVDEFLDVIVTDLRAREDAPSGTRSAAPARPSARTASGSAGHSGSSGSAASSGSSVEAPPDAPADPPLAADGAQRTLAITPEDVRNQHFSTTRLLTGYDESEVDEFLDRVEATLAVLQSGHGDLQLAASRSGQWGGDLLTAETVRETRFSTTRLRPGYDPGQVDTFLDSIANELERHGLR